MDDNSFDEHLKSKLENYEDPAFDPAALDSFHQMMSGLRPEPWYKQYAPHMVAAALLLLTLSNGYLIWSIASNDDNNAIALNNNNALSAAPAAISAYDAKQAAIDSLSNVITLMQCESQNNLAQAKAAAEQNHAALIQQANMFAKANEAKASESNADTHLGLVSDMPLAIYKALQEKGLLITKDGQAYLSSSIRKEYYPRRDSIYDRQLLSRSLPGGELDMPRYILISPQIATASKEEEAPKKEQHQKKTSLKAKNELEKHYFTGVGLNVGAHLDGMKNIFSPGSGDITPRFGLVADWVLSPKWSVETGLDYTYVSVDFNQYQSENLYHTGVTQLGTLQSSNLTCKLFSTPINIKYRQWITDTKQAVLRAGFTPYFSLNNEYRYNYTLKPYSNTGYEHLDVTAVSEVDKSYYYGGTVYFSAGITSLFSTKKPVKNKRTFETSVFYEKNLNGVGREKYGLQLVGIKTAIWLNLK